MGRVEAKCRRVLQHRVALVRRTYLILGESPVVEKCAVRNVPCSSNHSPVTVQANMVVKRLQKVAASDPTMLCPKTTFFFHSRGNGIVDHVGWPVPTPSTTAVVRTLPPRRGRNNPPDTFSMILVR